MSETRNFGADDRAIVLERQRIQKMAKSAHAYVRGNTVKYDAGSAGAAGPACRDRGLPELEPYVPGDRARPATHVERIR